MIEQLLKKDLAEIDDIRIILDARDPSDIELIRMKARDLLFQYCSDQVYFRGIVEFSNHCDCDCFYCGIRKSNHELKRYCLTEKEILECAEFSMEKGYGSMVLQSGERRDSEFVDFLVHLIRKIKKHTCSEKLKDGLGITLSVGEQTKESFQRLFDAGAHRYLLRIESSNPDLFRQIHPPRQTLEKRIQCLEWLKEIGFQVGTGVMIGIPGQTTSMLAEDILFFKKMNVDMIGMGPFLIHKATPMKRFEKQVEAAKDDLFLQSLLMIAATRIVLKNVNIASTTALQAIKEDGREQGLEFGANVIMPVVTPLEHRREYLLYEGKPCLDETAEMCAGCLERRILSIGRKMGYNEWGDSPHFKAKINK